MSRLCRLLLALLPAAFAVIVALPLVGQDAKPKAKRYALLVGVKSYLDRKLSDLEFTENDVSKLAKLLGNAGYQVTLLTDTAGKGDATRKPTAKNIQDQLAAVLKKATKHDTVLVAFSGHGLAFAKTKDSYFCPQDGNASDPATLVSLKGVYRDLEESRAGLGLLLVDACRDEAELGRGKGIDGKLAPHPPRGVAALFSCRPGQRSYETKKLGHGVFFHAVLEGLGGKAKNAKGEVTWARLAEFVSDKVSEEVPDLIGGGARQEPNEVKNLSGRSPVLLNISSDEVVTNEDGETKSGAAKSFTNSIGMKLVLIPRGKFLMGSPKDEKDRNADEWQHEVEISRPFYLGVYAVTQKQYKEVMGKNRSCFRADGGGKDKVKGLVTDDFPVEQVSWHDAVEFCEKLSQLEKERRAKRTYRLPTEAEWEYACRAGTTTPFHFGKSLSSRQANFDGNYPYGKATKGPYLGRTCAVGSYKPNAFGLYDMHGNVWQWCNDWYDKDYYKDSPEKDPPGADKDPPPGVVRDAPRVLRGGSWHWHGIGCRAALRNREDPREWADFIGFRVACSRPPRTP
jgi:formylglycine-generating enzyme required for sulfatase activity